MAVVGWSGHLSLALTTVLVSATVLYVCARRFTTAPGAGVKRPRPKGTSSKRRVASRVSVHSVGLPILNL